MSLYNDWNTEIENIKTEDQYKDFWTTYIPKETDAYKKILVSKNPVIKGIFKDLAQDFDMTCKQFIGFLDGANNSFKEEFNLEKLTEESEINVEFDFEKLLWNMHEVKADWLHSLEEWDNIFDNEKQKEIRKAFNRSKMAVSHKIGRNDPCPCGSGKKYKKCCGKGK